MHNHVIAGDFGYLPTYSDEEGYTYGSEALEGLKEYVNNIVDSTEGSDGKFKLRKSATAPQPKSTKSGIRFFFAKIPKSDRGTECVNPITL